MPTLLELCARSNNVFTRRAKACIFAVITHTSSPSILPFLAELLNCKSTSLRLVAPESVLTYVKSSNTPIIANNSRARLVENVIRATVEDTSADIRTAGKALLRRTGPRRLPDCVARFVQNVLILDDGSHIPPSFIASLTPVIRNGHAATGRARPVVSIQPQKSTSGKHTEREVNPLRLIALSKQMTYILQGTSVSVPSSTQSGNRQKDVALRPHHSATGWERACHHKDQHKPSRGFHRQAIVSDGTIASGDSRAPRDESY
ncbi:hypothetical protein AZE42_13141 [Rhizopogon vesiculosus]|uniref:CLASP N-terminal domain-containing protein n=1 Tax=Rhizopogon vesiculosus TaxID=180088 RepID=A0A1J8QEA4_9AGAM|nr:hypothetical protein AZE42_13141 [Rhizopogon vesiculosus]